MITKFFTILPFKAPIFSNRGHFAIIINSIFTLFFFSYYVSPWLLLVCVLFLTKQFFFFLCVDARMKKKSTSLLILSCSSNVFFQFLIHSKLVDFFYYEWVWSNKPTDFSLLQWTHTLNVLILPQAHWFFLATTWVQWFFFLLLWHVIAMGHNSSRLA
jgi:hypothetical protein